MTPRSTTASRLTPTALVVLLIAGACGGSGEQLPATASQVDTVPPSSVVATTRPVSDFFDYQASLRDWGELFARPDIQTTRAVLVDAAGAELVVETTDDLTGRDVGLGSASYNIDTLEGIADASDFTRIADERGGPFPLLIVATDDGSVLHVIELDESGRGIAEVRQGGDAPSLGADARWILRGIASGDYVVTLPNEIDPDIPTYCQNIGAVSTLPFSPGSDLVAGWVDFAIDAYLAGDGGMEDRRALMDHADRLASEIALEDPITGFGSGAWNSDVIDQALRGIPEEQWVFLPTVSVFIEPGTLSWVEGDNRGVTFSEAGSGRLLGWTAYFDDVELDEPLETDLAEVMAPPNGGDVEVHIVAADSHIGCLDDAGAPLMTVPFDDFAGSGRAVIHLDTGSYTAWDPP